MQLQLPRGAAALLVTYVLGCPGASRTADAQAAQQLSTTPTVPGALAAIKGVCESRASGLCTTCSACCHGWLAGAAAAQACAGCVGAECGASFCGVNRSDTRCNVCPYCCGSAEESCTACARVHCGVDSAGSCRAANRQCSQYDCNAIAVCEEQCVDECWHKPWSRCTRSCDLCEAGTLAVLLPFLGRLLFDQLLDKLKALVVKCLGPRINKCLGRRMGVVPPADRPIADATPTSTEILSPLTAAAAGTAPTASAAAGRFTMDDCGQHKGWKAAMLANDQTPTAALATATSRLLLWRGLPRACTAMVAAFLLRHIYVITASHHFDTVASVAQALGSTGALLSDRQLLLGEVPQR